jgi:hypothetical protein
MTKSDVLERTQGQPGWGEVYAQLTAADREGRLGPDDVERLAAAAHLLGREADSEELWARAHQEFLASGNPRRAARCAVLLAVRMLLRGEMARGSGWIARAPAA